MTTSIRPPRAHSSPASSPPSPSRDCRRPLQASSPCSPPVLPSRHRAAGRQSGRHHRRAHGHAARRLRPCAARPGPGRGARHHFPANSFNPAIAQLVGDTDLTNAHGSSGVAAGGVLGGTGMQAVTQILSGKATGNNVALNSGGIGRPAAGIGGDHQLVGDGRARAAVECADRRARRFEMSPLRSHRFVAHAALCVCMSGAALVASHAHAQVGADHQRRLDHRQRRGRRRNRRVHGQRNGRPDNAQANQITVSNGGVVGNENASVQSAVGGREGHERAGVDRSQCFFEFFRRGAGEPVRRSRKSAAQQHPVGHCGARSRDRLGWGAIRDGPEKRRSGVNPSGFIAYARQAFPAMPSRTSAGSCRSTRQPAPVMPRQTVLCSVPRRALF